MKSTVRQRVKPLLQKTVRIQNKDYPNGKMTVTLDTIEVEPSILIWDEDSGMKINLSVKELRLISSDLYWTAYDEVEEQINNLRLEVNNPVKYAPTRLKNVYLDKIGDSVIRVGEGSDEEISQKEFLPYIKSLTVEQEFCEPRWALMLVGVTKPLFTANWNSPAEIQNLTNLIEDDEALRVLASLTSPDEMASLTNRNKVKEILDRNMTQILLTEQNIQSQFVSLWPNSKFLIRGLGVDSQGKERGKASVLYQIPILKEFNNPTHLRKILEATGLHLVTQGNNSCELSPLPSDDYQLLMNYKVKLISSFIAQPYQQDFFRGY